MLCRDQFFGWAVTHMHLMSHVIPTTARVELSETAAAVGCVGGRRRRRRRRKEGRKTTATAGLRMETKEAGYGAYRFVVARPAAGSEVPRQNYRQETYVPYLLLHLLLRCTYSMLSTLPN